jgi:fermentation-respiration switch protein FrsA (DUF1100 family)
MPFILPFDIFANQHKITKIKKPIFIIHGTKDEVISFDHGLTLHKMIEKTPYAYEPWWVSGFGHNDIESEYVKKLTFFLTHYSETKYIKKIYEFVHALGKEEFPVKPHKSF